MPCWWWPTTDRASRRPTGSACSTASPGSTTPAAGPRVASGSAWRSCGPSLARTVGTSRGRGTGRERASSSASHDADLGLPRSNIFVGPADSELILRFGGEDDLLTRPTSATASRYALLPLRLFLGATFTFAGLQKLADPAYLDAQSPTSVQATMLSLQHQSPIGWMLGLSAHAPVLVGVSIALGELAVGLATLVGLWVRVAAAGGLLLSLTFFLTVSFHTRPYYYGSDIVFVFAWTVPLLAGVWPGWTADRWIAARARGDTDPHRRALVLGGVGAAVLAATAGVLAGITAAVGRALHSDAAPAVASLGPPLSSSPSSTQSASPSESPTGSQQAPDP